MAAADAPKKERLPAAERRQKIVDSARELFIAQGFSGARTKDIAEGAGVTEAFLYRYFESKEEMYSVSVLDPLRQGFEALADDIQVLFDTHSDPVEFILALNLRCLSFYSEFAALQTAALYSEPTNGRVFYTSTLEPILDRIGGLIAKRVGWEAQGLDVKIVRQAVLGSLWAIGVDFMLRPGSKNIDEVAVRLTRLFTSGVRERSLSA